MSLIPLRPRNVDRPLIDQLIRRWQRRYGPRPVKRADRALFRSLNMANQAAALPAGSDTTFYDVGRLIPLWVSAFEILAHNKFGRANLRNVYSLLEMLDWQVRKLQHRRYSAYENRTGPSPRRILACYLYGKLYQARNDFIHGNPIRENSINVRRSKLPIARFAAPLYRLALSSFLGIRWNRQMPESGGQKALRRYVEAHTAFHHNQRNAEWALLASLKPPLDDDEGE